MSKASEREKAIGRYGNAVWEKEMASIGGSDTQRFFNESEDYRVRRSIRGFYHPYDTKIIDLARTNSDDNSRILEVGGGSGYKLAQIVANTRVRDLYNCEIVANTYKKQDDPSIKLVAGDVLALPFKDSAFDFVLAVNLLHHLAEPTISRSYERQRKAVSEMMRVVRPGGVLAIGEICHHSRAVRTLVHRLCQLTCGMRIEIKSIGLSRGVTVSFITHRELRQLAECQEWADEVTVESFEPFKWSGFDLERSIACFLSENVLMTCRKRERV